MRMVLTGTKKNLIISGGQLKMSVVIRRTVFYLFIFFENMEIRARNV